MQKQYNVYSCAVADLCLYKEKDDFNGSVVDFTQDVLLDIVWAKDENEAVNEVAERYGVSPDTLAAELRVMDARLESDKFEKMQVSAWRTKTDCGYEINLQEGRTLVITITDPGLSGFIQKNDEARKQLLLQNGDLLTITVKNETEKEEK